MYKCCFKKARFTKEKVTVSSATFFHLITRQLLFGIFVNVRTKDEEGLQNISYFPFVT